MYPNLNCISIMMSFLTYTSITGFFLWTLNFCRFWPIMQIILANFNQTLSEWSLGGPLKILSVSAVLYPRWPPLLKIENTSNGQNYCIWSHDGLKFELYQYNYEFFNIYYGIFYELWTFTDFDRLCKLGINKQKII